MQDQGTFRRRRLPHLDKRDVPIFITACLKGSLSSAGLSRIRRYREELDSRPQPTELSENEWSHRKDKMVFKRIDELLDHNSPVRHLADERQAEIVQNAFLHFAGVRYSLFAFVVMPSHHHWLFLPNEEWSCGEIKHSTRQGGRERTPREIISHSIQSYTATMCNRLRGESGSYWQPETFDHWARDDEELQRIVHYIENNPVEAGLVEKPEEWRWSSARIRREKGIQIGDALEVG